MKPYYQDSRITLYHGDCRELLPALKGAYDVILTDPPWQVKANIPIVGGDRAPELLTEACAVMDPASRRLIIILGDQSDPRILQSVPKTFPFLRVCLMRRTPPPRRGSVMGIGDIVYIFGGAHLVDNGKKLLTGMCEIPSTPLDRRRNKESGHPCPRNMLGIKWLIGRYASTVDRLIDPFAGVGTTLIAAKYGGRKCIGIEIEERWCQVIAEELRQTTIESALPIADVLEDSILIV